MKTEAELRKYRDALRKVKNVPCDCASTGHDYECAMGGFEMQVAEMILSWVIGEWPDHDRVVEKIHAAAAKV